MDSIVGLLVGSIVGCDVGERVGLSVTQITVTLKSTTQLASLSSRINVNTFHALPLSIVNDPSRSESSPKVTLLSFLQNICTTVLRTLIEASYN